MLNSIDELKSLGVLMVNSHFDYGNGMGHTSLNKRSLVSHFKMHCKSNF